MATRPVVVPWVCQRSGDCCTSVDRVVMTPAERDLLIARRPDIVSRFEDWETGFVALRAAPCPLLGFIDGRALCTVHDIRPYNCRRFLCGRTDITTEAYEPEPWNPLQGQLGCRNLSDRIRQSRAFRRFYALIQRRAQRWAVAHGWIDDRRPNH